MWPWMQDACAALRQTVTLVASAPLYSI
jgi:hypothetical protein